eukprot:SAG31_NODE_6384_length_2037_cov_3.816305_2_plen_103_part_00
MTILGTLTRALATAATVTVAGKAAPADPCDSYLGVAAMPPHQQRALSMWTTRLGSAGAAVNAAAYPFCFIYGGEASSALLPSWAFAATEPEQLVDGTGKPLS